MSLTFWVVDSVLGGSDLMTFSLIMMIMIIMIIMIIIVIVIIIAFIYTW